MLPYYPVAISRGVIRSYQIEPKTVYSAIIQKEIFGLSNKDRNLAINCRFTASTVELRSQERRSSRERARVAPLSAAKPSQTPKRQSTWPSKSSSNSSSTRADN
jgi:hypothetical protein